MKTTGSAPAPPLRALRSLPWTEVELAALDFETTGLDLARDHIVSFGVVPVRSGRVVVGEALHQLVEPTSPPSRSSVAVHGIRPMDLAGSPRIAEASRTLARALDGKFLLVWFARVEVAFLARKFGGRPSSWSRRCIDVWRLAHRWVSGQKETVARHEDSLSHWAARLGIPVSSPHDALDDALVTAQLFLVLAEHLSPGPPSTVGALLRASRG